MSARVFVDSNIWLYAFIEVGADDGRHRRAVRALAELDRPVVSTQVIREVCVNLLKKTSASEPYLRELIAGWYRDCQVSEAGMGQFLLASRLREGAKFSYWDSLIVAAALNAGCSTLYSEDMQDGQVVDGSLVIRNPLWAHP